MTLKSNRNQSHPSIARGEQLIAGWAAKAVPRLRRSSHRTEDFLAGVVLIRGEVDLHKALSASALDSADVASGGLVPMSAGAMLEDPRFMGSDLDEEEDEDEEEDDDFDDDDLDEDDEDLDDEDDEYDDDDLDEDDDDLEDDLDDDIDEEE